MFQNRKYNNSIYISEFWVEKKTVFFVAKLKLPKGCLQLTCLVTKLLKQ